MKRFGWIARTRGNATVALLRTHIRSIEAGDCHDVDQVQSGICVHLWRWRGTTARRSLAGGTWLNSPPASEMGLRNHHVLRHRCSQDIQNGVVIIMIESDMVCFY